MQSRTGRDLESAVEVLEKNNVIKPDIIISSVGSEIFYGPEHYYDKDGKPIFQNGGNLNRLLIF